MLTMQAFYSQLQTSGKEPDGYFTLLDRLTQCTLSEVMAVRSEMIWELWDTPSA
ncbi:MAG TPA: hypothetical protein VFQ23_08685 [Anaerolineales bacterium]|nr:hypothetical protein [Anaerolineales bacterium]